MSSSEASARPRQLTLAGWFVVVASSMLVITVYSSVAGLNSVATRDQVAEWLATPTGQGLGLTVTEALSGLRAALMVTGLCAAASAVLGVFVLQRHRGARLALSIVVVPIVLANLLTAPLTGGLLGALIAAATVVLWTGPARDWFAGRPIRQPEAPVRREAPRADGPERPGSVPGPPDDRRQGPSAADLSTHRPSSQPPPMSGFGQAPGSERASLPPEQWGPPTGPPLAGREWQPQASWPAPVEDSAVPGVVKTACLLTAVFAGLVAMIYAVMLVVLVVAREQIVDYVLRQPAWEQANLDRGVLLPVLWLGCLLFLGWSVGSIVLAWFTWRRHNWARYVLAASAGAALLAGLFAFPLSLLHQLASAATIACLLSARSRAWFARSSGYWPPSGPPSGPPQGPYGRTQEPPYGPPPPAQPPSAPPPGQGKPPVW